MVELLNTLPRGMAPPDAEIAAHARVLLGNFNQSAIQTTRDRDERLSEVLMIDNDPANILVKVGVFQEVSVRVGHGWCAYACAQRIPGNPPVPIIDIRLFGQQVPDPKPQCARTR